MTGESGRRLVLFAKEPVAGRVKTRLARTIGEDAAAALYEAFLEDLSVALRGEWRGILAHDGDGGPKLRKIFKEFWFFETQGEGTLGERMARAFAGAFTGDSSKVVLVGSDAPTLTAADIVAAFESLDTSDIVFAPSPDGGYALVGLKRDGREGTTGGPSKVFEQDIRWSTPYALEDTEGAARRLGMRVARLATVPDVDVEEDLRALSSALSSDRAIAPRTRKALEHLLLISGGC